MITHVVSGIVFLSMGALFLVLFFRQKKISISIILVTIAMLTAVRWGSLFLRMGIESPLIKPLPFHLWLVLLLLPTVYFERERWAQFSLSTKNLRLSLMEGGVIGFCIIGLVILANFLIVGEINSNTSGVLWVDRILRTGQIAMFEELLMRGFVLGYILRQTGLPNNVANLWQSFLFSIMHVSYLDQQSYLLVGLMLLFGLCTGYITMKRGTIAGAFLAHFIVLLFN